MRTLFLAWQDKAATRAWYPIGRLDADAERSNFQFRYTCGAEMARNNAGLEPLDSFPDFHKIYTSSDLFPLFRNRILGEGREDFKEYIRQLGITSQEFQLLPEISHHASSSSKVIRDKVHTRQESVHPSTSSGRTDSGLITALFSVRGEPVEP